MAIAPLCAVPVLDLLEVGFRWSLLEEVRLLLSSWWSLLLFEGLSRSRSFLFLLEGDRLASSIRGWRELGDLGDSAVIFSSWALGAFHVPLFFMILNFSFARVIRASAPMVSSSPPDSSHVSGFRFDVASEDLIGGRWVTFE
jgi:hypothetical protein